MDNKYKLESNLQQMASIRVAENIWLSRPLMIKISNFVTENDIDLASTPDNKIKIKIREWLADTFEQVNSMKLPAILKKSVLYVMKPIGENLLDYLRRTSSKWNRLFKDKPFPKLNIYCKYIEFDCFGRVDEVKTFLNIYNAVKDVSLVFLFYEACTYCLDDLIHIIWNKCPDQVKFNIQLSVSDILSSRGSDMHRIQQYWIQLIRYSLDQTPLFDEITELDVLQHCILSANNTGVKYFVNKLSQDDKNVLIVKFADEIPDEIRACRITPILNLNKKQHICNLFYLFSQMTKDNRNKFIASYKRILCFFLMEEWPWKYLLVDYIDEQNYNWLFRIINKLKIIVDDYNYYKKIVYTDLWMIPEFWRKNPNRFKESIVEVCWSIEKPMMFKLVAVVLVTSVIDDIDGVNKLRPEICKGFEKHGNKFIEKQKYEVVDLYMKNILQNDEQRKSYKELLKSKNICGRLLLFKNFEEFDRFLNWRFDNDHVQITKFKKDFTADIVFLTLLCRVLKVHETDFEMPIAILFSVLEFDRSYQEQFKQKLINNYHFKAHLRNYIENDPKQFSYILTYFQFSSEEIDEIKTTFK